MDERNQRLSDDPGDLASRWPLRHPWLTSVGWGLIVAAIEWLRPVVTTSDPYPLWVRFVFPLGAAITMRALLSVVSKRTEIPLDDHREH